MKLYDDEGNKHSWLTLVVALIVGTVLWCVLGAVPIGLVFMIAGVEAAYVTMSIWAGFVGALLIVSIGKSIVKARKNARIHGK